MPLQLTNMTMQGFRCFPPEGVGITFDPLTCFIGPNGAGKTTAMIALRRLFGVEAAERRIRPDDFHLSPGESLSDESERELTVEAKFVLVPADGESDFDIAEAAVFEHMAIDGPGGTLFLRVQMVASWSDDGSLEGDIDQTLYWVTTPSADLDEIEGARKKMSGADRSLIRAVYVSATRDPATDIRGIATTSLGRLLRAAVWSDGFKNLVDTQAETLAAGLQVEGPLKAIKAVLKTRWPQLYRGAQYGEAILAPAGTELSHLVTSLRPRFSGPSLADSVDVEHLSDGYRSLFSLAFAAALLDLEHQVRLGNVPGLNSEDLRLPVLTIFLVEEPENHVSPHHLGRVVRQLENISESAFSQSILTSHAPSIVGRLEPTGLRHFRGHEHVAGLQVRSLTLPEDSTEAGKYVRQAVRAYPELYFSRVVVLGEGASESVVLSRLFIADGNDLDTEQISVVPLGGRHVQHFWRLLTDLGIPYATLLDLDTGRQGGGWDRVKGTIRHLLSRGVSRQVLLEVDDDEGGTCVMTEEEFDDLTIEDTENLTHWADDLAQYGVFFSAPLDLDWSLLGAFTDEYQAVSLSRPRFPKDPENQSEYLERACKAVLGDGASTAGYEDDLDLFPWYRSLFIQGSKPGAHMEAMASISDADLLAQCPPSLLALLKHCTEQLAHDHDRGEDDEEAADDEL